MTIRKTLISAAQLMLKARQPLAWERGYDGDSSDPFQFHEISESGDYRLTIAKGGQGAICLSAAG